MMVCFYNTLINLFSLAVNPHYDLLLCVNRPNVAEMGKMGKAG